MRQMQKCGIVGAGQMGLGIAQVAAEAGLQVVLSDQSAAHAAKAKEKLGTQLKKLVEKGKKTQAEVDLTLSRVLPVGAVLDAASDLGSCDIIIEAATENPSLKEEISGSSGQARRVVGYQHLFDQCHGACRSDQEARACRGSAFYESGPCHETCGRDPWATDIG